MGVEVADGAAKPAFGGDTFRLAGVPDVHGPEVRAIGVGVSDAVDDGDAPVVIELLQGSEDGVEAVMVVDVQDVFLSHADGGAIVAVERVGVGDHGVHVVVAAGQLYDNQDRVAVYAGHCTLHAGHRSGPGL